MTNGVADPRWALRRLALVDGYSWTSSAGGSWSASALETFTILPVPTPVAGISVLNYYVLASPRYLLADHIRDAFAASLLPELADFTVYPYQPDNLAAPAIVIGLDDPAQAPSTLGGQAGSATAWAFLVKVTVPAFKTEGAQNAVETAWSAVRAALRPTDFRWVEVSAPEREEVAGRDYLVATMGIGYIQDDPLVGG